MLIELIIALLLGCTMGTITGLIPGIHINLVSAMILASPFIIGFDGGVVVVFIISMAITHTFIDFIPSIYLGAPDEDTGLSTLPGHKLLLMGRGHEAVMYSLQGSALAIGILVLLIPLFLFVVPLVLPFLSRMMGFFLMWIVVLLLYMEKDRRVESFILFILAGFLGIAALNMSVREPLLPLLTGLFGSSTIIFSLKQESKIPKQFIKNKSLIKRDKLIRPTAITAFVSPIAALFPGLGSSQAAVAGSAISKKLSSEEFLILLGSINTLIMGASFIIVKEFQNARTGAANAILQVTQGDLLSIGAIITIILVSSSIALFLTLVLSVAVAKRIERVPYKKISYGILVFLTCLIGGISGTSGLLIFSCSTILGLACIYIGVRRGFLMGSLLIPTIIFYLPF